MKKNAAKVVINFEKNDGIFLRTANKYKIIFKMLINSVLNN